MSEKACQRAHALAQQLLTFAKGGTTIKKIAALKPLLQGIGHPDVGRFQGALRNLRPR